MLNAQGRLHFCSRPWAFFCIGNYSTIKVQVAVGRVSSPAGAVGIALFGVQTCQISGHSQVILAEGTVRFPVVGRHDGLQALRNSVVVVVAEHIQFFLHGLHQAVQRYGGQKVKRRFVGLIGRVDDGHTVGGTVLWQMPQYLLLCFSRKETIIVSHFSFFGRVL